MLGPQDIRPPSRTSVAKVCIVGRRWASASSATRLRCPNSRLSGMTRAACAPARGVGEGGRQILHAEDFARENLHAARRCHAPDAVEEGDAFRKLPAPEEGDAPDRRQSVEEQLEPLPA